MYVIYKYAGVFWRRKMHSLLIYNPVSGRKESRAERLGKIVSELTENGNILTVYQTQAKGDAQSYIENIKSLLNYDRIICCGGDGTLHEVINGMMKHEKRTPLGYIPMGSTNDYAKNLGITRVNALKCLANSKQISVDIGCMNGEYFNYVAAFGAFTRVSFATPQQMKNTFGYFAYILEGMKQLSDIVPKRISFCVDGAVSGEDDIILGMITNTFSVAGMKNFNRGSIQLNDGKMEYLFIKAPKNLMELQNIIGLLLSEKTDERYMYYGQFQKLEMQAEQLELSLDGENGGIHDKINIEIAPDAIEIITLKQEIE